MTTWNKPDDALTSGPWPVRGPIERTKTLSARVSLDVYDRCEAAAGGRLLSEWLREMISAHLAPDRPAAPTDTNVRAQLEQLRVTAEATHAAALKTQAAMEKGIKVTIANTPPLPPAAPASAPVSPPATVDWSGATWFLAGVSVTLLVVLWLVPWIQRVQQQLLGWWTQT